MTKQVMYPNFVTRIFATSLDLFFVTTIVTPIMRFCSSKLFVWNFPEYLAHYGINMDNPNAIAIAMRSAEFGKYVTGEKYATYIGCVFLISFVLLSFYFIFFWYKMGWTPGKYILGLRVVDADTLERISLYQSIKRFIWYALALISIWFIIFTKKHQGLHDKIARTIVIKR